MGYYAQIPHYVTGGYAPASVALLRPPVDILLKSMSMLGPMPPIGVAYVAAALRQAGHTIQVIDTNGRGRRLQAEYQSRQKPDAKDRGPGYSVGMGLGFLPNPAHFLGGLGVVGRVGRAEPGRACIRHRRTRDVNAKLERTRANAVAIGQRDEVDHMAVHREFGFEAKPPQRHLAGAAEQVAVDFGEAVVAVVIGGGDEKAMIAAAREKLAAFKAPKRVFFVDDLPRNAMGKVQKNVLRETYKDVFA